MSKLVLVFEGSDLEADILKNNLEGIDVKVLLKSETNSALTAGFGSIGLCQVFIRQDDLHKASEIMEIFESRK